MNYLRRANSSASKSDSKTPRPSFSHLVPVVNPANDPTIKNNEICLFVRFLKIGHVDTKNQRFVAKIEVIARWKPVVSSLFREFVEQNRDKILIPGVENDVEQIRRILPKINVNNLEAVLHDRVYYKMKPDSAYSASEIEFMEMYRSLKGVFFEKLELEDFPFDVQDICVRFSLDASCAHYFKLHMPHVGTPAGLLDDTTIFQDAQEWYLSRMVVNGENNVDGEEDENEVKGRAGVAPLGCVDNELVIRTNVRRKFTYHLYNCYLVMAFFAIMSYCNFANTPENVQFRLAGGLTLVLTSVAYKLMLSNTLPTISYLTLVDKYVLMQIFMLTMLVVAFAVLHVFYRVFKVGIDFTEHAVNCPFQFTWRRPRDSCELQAFANFSDTLTIGLHGSLQVISNIYFCFVAYKKKIKSSFVLRQQEEDYKCFLKTSPDLRENMWNQNIVLPPTTAKHSMKLVPNGSLARSLNNLIEPQAQFYYDQPAPASASLVSPYPAHQMMDASVVPDRTPTLS